ncbi:hypothetical protein GFV16_10795 [Bacillus megaterium]|uniref:hypothetical protein n=1 Tax=Priestia megaterium TaxID=1404 RepID=UPI0012940B54|nr:hypothetical protein [Priestia megaterium]MQR86400.1 hypothetical protein [Priestia megaterium]
MFWRYLKLIISSWILQAIAFLDLIGFATTYFGTLQVPYWIYLCLLIIALVLSGYNIYKNSAPKIVIDTPKQEDVSLSFPTVYNDHFRINMKSYLTNFGLQSGSIEYINLKFVNVNDLKDEFIMQEIGISGTEGELSKEKYFSPFSTGNDKNSFKFPMIVEPNTMLPFYLRIDISLAFLGDKEEIRRKVAWLKYVQLELEYKVKDSFGTEKSAVPFKINLQTLPEVLERAIESNDQSDQIDEIFS